MRRVIELPSELDWVVDELETALQEGEAEIASAGRPEYALGFYAAARKITEGIEAKYQALLDQRRQIATNRSAPVA